MHFLISSSEWHSFSEHFLIFLFFTNSAFKLSFKRLSYVSLCVYMGEWVWKSFDLKTALWEAFKGAFFCFLRNIFFSLKYFFLFLSLQFFLLLLFFAVKFYNFFFTFVPLNNTRHWSAKKCCQKNWFAWVRLKVNLDSLVQIGSVGVLLVGVDVRTDADG